MVRKSGLLTRGGAINGVLGDILPMLFLEHASTDFNENSHGSNQASDVEFGYFIFFDKALRPDLWPIFRKLSFLTSVRNFTITRAMNAFST